MNIKQQEVHYYGIISGICKKIGLVEEINGLTSSDPQRKVSVGQGVLALIINGMGLTMSKPMYLIPEFFRTKSTEILIGKGISPDDLNDDSLGRALDQIAETGVSKIFSHVAFRAAKVYKIATNHLHGDTTNMQVHGDYEEDGDLIAFGYPKHGRSDLKQYILSLITSFDGAVPLFMGVLRGNTSDTKHFKDLISLIEKDMADSSEDIYFILDAAAYCAENLKTLDKVYLITRVPERISAARELKESYAFSPERLEGNDDYKFAEVCSVYAEVKQRWVVVYSRLAHEREKKTIQALVKKEKEQLEKDVTKFCKQTYSCHTDAEKDVEKFAKQYKFHKVCIHKIDQNQRYTSAGRPLKNSPTEIFYTIELKTEVLAGYIEKQIKLGGMFVLATTQLDDQKLPTQKVLLEYKGQSPLENRFNLIKNASCISSKVYLKNESRITALTMIICLSVLIYALAERELRRALVALKETVPHQTKKPIQNPTMKWIFQMFEGVGLVTVETSSNTIQEVTNLTNILKKILSLLGEECMSMYLLTPTG